MMVQLNSELAHGAILLRSRSESVPCIVMAGEVEIACEVSHSLAAGTLILNRLADGRQTANGVEYARILVTKEVAEACEAARLGRLAWLEITRFAAQRADRSSYSQGVIWRGGRGR